MRKHSDVTGSTCAYFYDWQWVLMICSAFVLAREPQEWNTTLQLYSSHSLELKVLLNVYQCCPVKLYNLKFSSSVYLNHSCYFNLFRAICAQLGKHLSFGVIAPAMLSTKVGIVLFSVLPFFLPLIQIQNNQKPQKSNNELYIKKTYSSMLAQKNWEHSADFFK